MPPRPDGPSEHEGRGDVPARDTDPRRPADDSPVDEVLDGDEPDLAALLTTISARLTTPPDELTTRRHLRAMRQARGPGLLVRVAQRTGTAAAIAMVVGGLLAGGGLLPDQMQREVADAVAHVGIQLPRPTPGDAGADRADADRDHAEPSESDGAGNSPEPAAPEQRSETPGREERDAQQDPRSDRTEASDADDDADADRSGPDRDRSVVELPDVGETDDRPEQERPHPDLVPVEPPFPAEADPDREQHPPERRDGEATESDDAQRPDDAQQPDGVGEAGEGSDRVRGQAEPRERSRSERWGDMRGQGEGPHEPAPPRPDDADETSAS